MWHDGAAAFKFWALLAIAVSIVFVLSIKAALIWFLQQRAAKRERDEHETSGHSA